MPTCPKCDKYFTQQHNLNYHLNNAKNKCTDIKTVTKGKHKTVYMCHLCNKVFTRLYNLKQHILLLHESKLEDKIESTIQKQLDDFKKEFMDMNKKQMVPEIINVTNNVMNVTNIITNYYINTVSKVNTDYIKDKVWEDAIDNPYRGIPHMIKCIHFNPEHKENHNIRSNNLKMGDSYILYDNKFERKLNIDIIPYLISDNIERLEGYMETHPNKYSEDDRIKFTELGDTICESTKDLDKSKKNLKNTKTGEMINLIENIIKDSHDLIKFDRSMKDKIILPPHKTNHNIKVIE